MELAGPWRAARATDDLRRDAIGLGYDDSGWPIVDVPGHWRNHPAFADNDDPVLYRTGMRIPEPAPGERTWVILDGVFYQADVWLDGAYLGDPEGYFIPHAFDITDLARLTDRHVLAVEVACARQGDLANKRNLTGVFQHHEFGGPVENPGGLWRPVRIETTGPVRIDRCRVLCRDANADRAHLRVRARLDSDTSRKATIRTLVDGVVLAEHAHQLATGSNDVAWNVDVRRPQLWWPWQLGPASLTEVAIEVVVDGELAHRSAVRTGLREVAMQSWQLTVNGERIFVLGASVPPTRLDLAEATADQIRADVLAAKDAGLNLLRVQGHVARPELYDAADEAGMLIWQDMPLQWGYSRTVRRQATRQATELVDLHGHHPSIVLWCGHNAPADLRSTRAEALDRSIGARLVAGQVPSWNELLLDPWIKRAFERADETRPVVGSSGTVPRAPWFEGGDTHLWFGWFHGDAAELQGVAAAVPRLVRFVSDCGAAAPASADQASIDERRRADLSPLLERVPWERRRTRSAWVIATQQYQASVLDETIRALRRLKYRPTGGVIFSALYDPVDAIGFGILGFDRQPKLAHAVVRAACQPAVLAIDPLPAELSVGDAIALDVHVVNDRRVALEAARVDATLSWSGGEHRWSFAGGVGADEVARVGIVRFVVPEARGQLRFEVVLSEGGEPLDSVVRSAAVRRG